MTSTSRLDARLTAPPPALERCMRGALDARVPAPDVPGTHALDAAMILVESILRDATGSRTGAITLLAADALVTRAFEEIAEAPERIERVATEAMVRIAAAAAEAR